MDQYDNGHFRCYRSLNWTTNQYCYNWTSYQIRRWDNDESCLEISHRHFSLEHYHYDIHVCWHGIQRLIWFNSSQWRWRCKWWSWKRSIQIKMLDKHLQHIHIPSDLQLYQQQESWKQRLQRFWELFPQLVFHSCLIRIICLLNILS